MTGDQDDPATRGFDHLAALDDILDELQAGLQALLAEHRDKAADPDLAAVERTFQFAFDVHRYTRDRQAGGPYITHPLAVATVCAENQMDSEAVCAALLHDVVEDAIKAWQYFPAELSEVFGVPVDEPDEETLVRVVELRAGAPVARLVDGLTKLRRETIGEDEDLKVENYKKLLRATVAEDIRALVIKTFDRCHNITSVGVFKPDKTYRIATETMSFYVPMAERLGFFKHAREMEDHVLQVLQPSMWQLVESWLQANLPPLLQEVESRMTAIGEGVADAGAIVRHELYPKGHFTIAREVGLEEEPSRSIADGCNFNLCIICRDVDACFRVLNQVHEHFAHVLFSVSDFIHHPKINGYRSLHTLVTAGVPKLQVLIRTPEMDDHNHLGVIAEINAGRQQDKAWIEEVLVGLEQLGNGGSGPKIDVYFPEIQILTPAGDPLSLRKGTTALEFAYRLHSELGDRASGAIIDGVTRSLDTVLRTGQRVEIVAGDRPPRDYNRLRWVNRPRYLEDVRLSLRRLEREAGRDAVDDFLGYCKDKLRITLERDSREYKTFLDSLGYFKEATLGRELIAGRLDYERAVLHILRWARPPVMRKLIHVLKDDGVLSEDEVLEALALKGRRQQRSLLLELACEHYVREGPPSVSIRITDPEPRRPMPIQLAGCCRPSRGAAIVAYTSPERGAQIHREDCANVARLVELRPWPAPLARAVWHGAPRLRPYRFLLRGGDRAGLVAAVTRRVFGWKLNMRSIHFHGGAGSGVASGQLIFDLDEFTDPERLAGTLRTIEGIDEVEVEVEGG